MTDSISLGDLRRQRRTAMLAIAISLAAGAGLWVAIRHHAPIPAGMDDIGARLAFAVKALLLACIFSLGMAVEAVAHERLQTNAFDPLAGHGARRLLVNQRYLQNTVEQFILFAVGLVGLALYSPDGDAMRAVTASTVTWLLARIAFWIGYHRSAALRGLGAWSMLLSQLMLLYAGACIGGEMAGPIGAGAVLGAVLLFEAVLFWFTREQRVASSGLQ